ncbi:MAG: FGGY family carbohydrate kinase [Anditalea sp.]
MSLKQGYMIVDIGTGNVRVAMVGAEGEILDMQRDNVVYKEEEGCSEALSFDPEILWSQILHLTKKVLQSAKGVEIRAITASSQREGIVLMDEEGKALIGLPNHDHRGRQWEDTVQNKNRVYELVGRYPTSLFSALKLRGIKEKSPAIYEKIDKILSISDWAQYMFSGVMGYEHSQASETLLYDVAETRWSEELCGIFGVDQRILPDLHHSGTLLGNILPEQSELLDLPSNITVIVGGADTQLAIKSTQPITGDIVIVSGTTTPIIKVIEKYQLDPKQRTWTGRHIEKGALVLEANAGVTGLNYQRVKEIFYPNEGYEVIEKELKNANGHQCIASLGSLLANEPKPLIRGGFIFNAPVSHQLTRSSFVQAVLWDIACSIKENYEVLCEVEPYERDYVWVCGGGFQSPTFTQYVANLINKRVMIRNNFSQASVVGGALVCRESLGDEGQFGTEVKEFYPETQVDLHNAYKEWKNLRTGLSRLYSREVEE